MEMWRFWLGIGIIFSSLCVAIAILIRKHKDKHRYQALQTNLDNLEKNFKYLSEDIEAVVNSNLEIMESKCSQMQELFNVADKKCLYADNLLKAIEEKAGKLLKQNLAVSSNLEAHKMDVELVRELEESLDTVNRHLGFLNQRIEALESYISQKTEKKPENSSSQIESNLDKEILQLKREMDDIRQNISDIVTSEISRQLSPLDNGFAEIASAAIELDQKPTKLIESEDDMAPNNNVTELFRNKFKPEKESASPINREYYPKGKELVVKEIMEHYEQGVSIPQIASELNMSRGEIRLIITMNSKLKTAGKDN